MHIYRMSQYIIWLGEKETLLGEDDTQTCFDRDKAFDSFDNTQNDTVKCIPITDKTASGKLAFPQLCF